MSIPLLVVVLALYFIAMIGLSLYGRKKAADMDSYLDAGKTAGVLLIIGSQVGSHIGNGVVVGGAGSGAELGIGGSLYGISCAFSCVVIGLVLAPWVRNHTFRSPPEYFEWRYGSRPLSIIYVLALTATNVGLIGGQLVAGRALFETLGLNGAVGIFCIAAVVLIYSQLAGMWGTMATSLVQTVIIMVALVFCGGFLLFNGGIDTINGAVASGAVPATHLDFSTAYTLPAALMLFIPPAISGTGDVANFQRINSAKSTGTIITGQLISAVLVGAIAAIPVFIGMYANAAFGVTGNSAFFMVIQDVLPPVLAAIVFAAVIAAIMSTIDCLYIVAAQMFLNDIYVTMVNPKADPDKLRKWTLPINLIFTACAIVIALGASSIVDLLSSTLTFVTAAALVPLFGGILWKGATKQGATVSAAVGFIFAALSFFGIFELPYSGVTIYLPGLIAFIVASLVTQDKAPSQA